MAKTNNLYQDEMERRYMDVAQDLRLHPDDDCDAIMDHLCAKYPQYRLDEEPNSKVSFTLREIAAQHSNI